MMIHVIAQDMTNETQIAGVPAVGREMLEKLRMHVAVEPRNKRVWLEEGLLRVERAVLPEPSPKDR